jgi:hypothetical protein
MVQTKDELVINKRKERVSNKSEMPAHCRQNQNKPFSRSLRHHL